MYYYQKNLQKLKRIKINESQYRMLMESGAMLDGNENKKEYNDKQIEVKNKQLEIEYIQMNDGNPYNDKIKD